MFAVELIFLVLIGLIGIIFNWLLILAIQRKTYHYQETHRISTPITPNLSLLQQPSPSVSGKVIRPPLLPSSRSSMSTFDKYILAFLVNDIFVCNFLIPLRFIDLSKGIPCAFLCFMLKFFERLTIIIEIILINLLLITSLIFFYKKHCSTTKLLVICLIIMTPLIIIYLATTLTYLDVYENDSEQNPPSCKQIYYYYMTKMTCKNLNMICCLISYCIILLQFILLIRMKWAIKKYKHNGLRGLTEAAILTRNVQQEISLFEQNNMNNTNRRSIYTPSTGTSIATDITPTTQRSHQVFDYLTYLTVIENSHTLVKTTYLILFIDLFVYIPYWVYELLSLSSLYYIKDLYLLCHILKPFCYMLIDEKYRYHVLAILQCQPFRMLPMTLRRKSRVVTLNNANTNLLVH